MRHTPRNLVLILGDQLDEGSSTFAGFDPTADAVWMAEADEESTLVWTHKARITLFLAAMRHFRDALRQSGTRVLYRQLDDRENQPGLGGALATDVTRLRPRKLIVVQPGECRVEQELRDAAAAAGVELEIRPDLHFLCSREEFGAHVASRKQLRMEFFCREMRRRHRVLMEGDKPAGGAWNFDVENRQSFGPGNAPEPRPPRTFPRMP